jgi:gamma-glutamylcyclotransferase (GGCT)/AIG2-like uncharacterized protein YtfP
VAASFNLFAYGTLRIGGVNVGVLEGCEHMGSGTVRGTLYDIEGRYPALLLYGEAPVRGDVWRCPASFLARLDEFENVSSGLYRRMAAEARLDDGSSAPCWLYTAGPALSQQLLPDRRIPGGEWPVPT